MVRVNYFVHFVETEPGTQVKLQFWDTLSSECGRNRSLCLAFYTTHP